MAFPGNYNFSYYRGDTAEFVIRPKTANGSAFDLSDFSAVFTIATARGSGVTQYEAQAVVNSETNIITCTILPNLGRSLAAGSYVYDVQITSGPSVINTVLTGTMTVTNDITGAQ